MAVVTEDHERLDRIALRQEAHYWRSQHRRAVGRESQLKDQLREAQERIRQLEAAHARLEECQSEQASQLVEKDRQIEALKARVAWLGRQLFGRKSEATEDSTDSGADPPGASAADGGASCDSSNSDSSPDDPEGKPDKRKRGQQPGAKLGICLGWCAISWGGTVPTVDAKRCPAGWRCCACTVMA